MRIDNYSQAILKKKSEYASICLEVSKITQQRDILNDEIARLRRAKTEIESEIRSREEDIYARSSSIVDISRQSEQVRINYYNEAQKTAERLKEIEAQLQEKSDLLKKMEIKKEDLVSLNQLVGQKKHELDQINAEIGATLELLRAYENRNISRSKELDDREEKLKDYQDYLDEKNTSFDDREKKINLRNKRLDAYKKELIQSKQIKSS